MFEHYKAKIEEYCKGLGIEIPIGFDRHPVGRFVAIDMEATPPKLVATTWSHRRDAAEYLVRLGEGHRTRLLDFMERRVLALSESRSLVPTDHF